MAARADDQPHLSSMSGWIATQLTSVNPSLIVSVELMHAIEIRRAD
jgi:hypothetical protein